jgi:hypothetical protein
LEVRVGTTDDNESLTTKLAQAVAGCPHVTGDRPVTVEAVRATKTTTDLAIRFWHDATDGPLAVGEVHTALTAVLLDLPWFSVGVARS